MNKNKNGITLIALVITIIVLLILAGISISLVMGQNGVLTRAEDASSTYSMSSAKEQANMRAAGYVSEYTEKVYVDNDLTVGAMTAGEYVLSQIDGEEDGDYGYSISGSTITVTNKTTGQALASGTVRDDGGISWSDSVATGGNTNNNNTNTNNTPIEVTIESIQTEATKPYLPTGYNIAQESITAEQTTTGGALSEGLIITDGNNEYVWVEVPRTIYSNELQAINSSATLTDNQYTEIETTMQTYASTYRKNGYTDTYNSSMGTVGNITNETEYNTEKKKMLKSVFDNGGFYVGRYEAGIELSSTRTANTNPISDSLVPLSKANVAPLNFVTVNQAQSLAIKVAPSGYTSSLMFGIQWDLMLKHLETKTDLTVADIKDNSSSWGNYYDSTFDVNNLAKAYNTSSRVYEDLNPDTKPVNTVKLLTTGATKGAESTNSKANIHDVAGNEFELTLEYTSNSATPISGRGGVHSNLSTTYSAGSRAENGNNSDSSRNTVSFRVTLY